MCRLFELVLHSRTLSSPMLGGAGFVPHLAACPRASISWLRRADSCVRSQGSSLRDALHSAFRMLPRQGHLQSGRLQPGHLQPARPQPGHLQLAHPRPWRPLPGHRLPGQPPRHPLRQEYILLEQHQWAPCPSGHLLPGQHQPRGPPGRAQVRGTLQGKQEEQGSRRVVRVGSGGSGEVGQKGAIPRKPKTVENWSQRGRGEGTRTNPAAVTLEAAQCGSEFRFRERGLWLETGVLSLGCPTGLLGGPGLPWSRVLIDHGPIYGRKWRKWILTRHSRAPSFQTGLSGSGAGNQSGPLGLGAGWLCP